LAANGIKPGKSIYVVNGLYGDEYTGMEAIYQLFQELDSQNMSGAFLGIPMLNTPAFDLIKRTGPDEIIMNRTGAGKAEGFLTEKITRFFMDHIVSQADYGVEIIEIGMHYAITSFVALVEKPEGPVDLKYAKSFGSDLLWVGSASPTVMRNAAAQKGVDVFMTELGGGAKVVQEHVGFELKGLKNLLKYLGVMSGEPTALPKKYTTYDGFWMHSNCGGVFRSRLNLRQEVKQGEVLATIHDLLDRELEVIRAPYDGIIIGFRTTVRIHPGDWTVWVGRVVD
jgi:predicted deacylase